jgi:predicted Zn-dependent peptidase
MSGNHLPKYYIKTLKNGLEVVAIPLNNETDVVSIDIFYKVGSINETMGKSGIAHMLEHLNFKSTKNLKAGEFDEIVKSFGGINNASTGFDFTHYFIKTSSKNMEKSIELFSELMQNLSLKDSEFQPERLVVAEERRWRTDNSPMGYLYFRLFNNAFIYHPYHWTPIGFKEDINNWDIEDIKKFHSLYYVPNNAILIISGDIKKESVFSLAKKYFENIPKGQEIPKIHTVEPPQDGQKRVTVFKESEVEMLSIAFKIPSFKDKDMIALNAIGDILSGGKSTRLEKRLIDQKQLVNQIYAYAMDGKDPSLFIIVAVCNPGVKAEDVEKEIWQELDSLKEKINQKELEKVKINTKASFIYNIENSSNVSSLFGSYLARGDIKPLLEYEENINNLDIKTIKSVAKKYFIKKSSTTLILKKETPSGEE